MGQAFLTSSVPAMIRSVSLTIVFTIIFVQMLSSMTLESSLPTIRSPLSPSVSSAPLPICATTDCHMGQSIWVIFIDILKVVTPASGSRGSQSRPRLTGTLLENVVAAYSTMNRFVCLIVYLIFCLFVCLFETYWNPA